MEVMTERTRSGGMSRPSLATTLTVPGDDPALTMTRSDCDTGTLGAPWTPLVNPTATSVTAPKTATDDPIARCVFFPKVIRTPPMSSHLNLNTDGEKCQARRVVCDKLASFVAHPGGRRPIVWEPRGNPGITRKQRVTDSPTAVEHIERLCLTAHPRRPASATV